MLQTTLELLVTIPIFSKLDRDSLKEIVPLFQEKTYEAGETLFRENTFGDRLFIIVDGQVAISKKERRAEESTELALRRRGDIFGEMSLLDEEPRFATARAVKKTFVLELSKPDFFTMLNDHPLIAYQIMRILSSRIRQSDLHLVDELRKKNKQLSDAYHNLKAYAEALTDSNRELNQAKNFLERVISTSPFSIIVTKQDNTISLFNKTAEKEYGYLSVEVTGKKVQMLRGGANLLDLDEEIKGALKQEGIWQGEIIARRKDDEHFIADTIICEVLDEANFSSTILHICKNVTNEKNLSRQALELERMATRGEMAAEVAHELNNYLQIVRGNLDLLTRELGSGTPGCFEKRIPRMQNELEKISRFVNNLMDFAVPRSVKQSFDLVNFIEKELFFLRPQNRFDEVIFKADFDRTLPFIEADQGQLQQIFYNLMNNAADALNSISHRERTISIKVDYLKDQRQAEITIGDNGTGIDRDRLSKIFKERFTTKEKGHGFGLLSVRRAVDNHYGNLQVESEEGKGTTFTIRLPLRQPAVADGEESSSGQPAAFQEKWRETWI